MFSIQRGEVRIVIDRDALLTFYDFPAEPPAISGGAGLNIHPVDSATDQIVQRRDCLAGTSVADEYGPALLP